MTGKYFSATQRILILAFLASLSIFVLYLRFFPASVTLFRMYNFDNMGLGWSNRRLQNFRGVGGGYDSGSDAGFDRRHRQRGEDVGRPRAAFGNNFNGAGQGFPGAGAPRQTRGMEPGFGGRLRAAANGDPYSASGSAGSGGSPPDV